MNPGLHLLNQLLRKFWHRWFLDHPLRNVIYGTFEFQRWTSILQLNHLFHRLERWSQQHSLLLLTRSLRARLRKQKLPKYSKQREFQVEYWFQRHWRSSVPNRGQGGNWGISNIKSLPSWGSMIEERMSCSYIPDSDAILKNWVPVLCSGKGSNGGNITADTTT